jgi:hypothetical protein
MTRIAQPSHDAPSSEWTVYADALQEANDPRGELIALNQAVASGMSPADRDAYVSKHRDALFGPAAAHFDNVRIRWIGCIADEVDIRILPGNDAAGVMAAFLGSPLAQGTRSLSVIGAPENRQPVNVAPAIEALIASWPEHARSLALVDERASQTTMLASRDFEPPDNLVAFGALEGIWKLPLEHVRFVVADSHQLELGAIAAPRLRSFVLHCLRYGTSYDGDAPLSAVLAGARWPELRTFELHLPEEYMANIIADEDAYIPYYAGNEDYEDRAGEEEEGENVEGVNWTQLRGLFDNLAKTPLERLALGSFDSTSSLLETLQAAGLPTTLVELDLSDSSVRSPDWFLENKALLHGVKRLVLEHVSMSEGDAKQLAGLGPTIVHSSGAGAKYRYVVGSE